MEGGPIGSRASIVVQLFARAGGYIHKRECPAGRPTLLHPVQAKECVEGMADAESFSPEYKEMLQDVFAQGAKELGRKGSVARVEATSDTLYVADSTAYVYLDLVFTDSVHEQVTLPMVFKKGEWRLR